MAQLSARLCKNGGCRELLVTINHGKPVPAAGAVVLCFEPMSVRCPWCGHVSVWEVAKAS